MFDQVVEIGATVARFWLELLLGVLFAFIGKRILFPLRIAPTRKPTSPKRSYQRGTGKDVPCKNPRTGETFATRKAYTPEEVQASYERAKVAQVSWAKTSFAERRAVLLEVSDWLLENHKEVAEMSVRESGKTVTEAYLGEIITVCEKIRWTVCEGEDFIKPESRKVPALLRFTKKARVEYHPLGVIGMIVPFNYPINHIISHAVTALFTGNGALIKVSETTSFSAEPIEDVFRVILARRGHNPDLVQVVTGFGQTGAALVQSGVDKVLFIGSPGVGKLIMKGASANLTPVILELGGKDAICVFDDCDFENAMGLVVTGSMVNCGQNCIAAERLYVQAGIYDKFVAELKKRIEAARCPVPGDSKVGVNKCDFGSVTLPAQIKHLNSLLEDATSKGARIVSGGKLQEGSGKGLLFQPTIVADVTHEMELANEEAFGPIATLIKFTDEKHLVSMVNLTPYGLGSSVFTSDYVKAERVGRQIRSGMLNINDFATCSLIGSLPFGGVDDSGFGCFNGPEGLRGFMRLKSVVTDRFSFIKTYVPPFLVYPQPKNSHVVVEQAIKMLYSATWKGSIVAVFGLIKALVFPEK